MRALPIWAALIGVVLLLAVQFPLLKDPLKEIGLRGSDDFRTTIIALVLIGVLIELRELTQRVSPKPGQRKHYTNPQDMYHDMLLQARRTSRRDQRRLDVLGLTLYSAWPTMSFELQQQEFQDWKVRLATLSPDATHLARWVPDSWFEDSRVNVQAIERFSARSEVKERGITLEVIPYDFVPCVHGFRLGNGDIYISTVLWQGDGQLGYEGFSYQFIPASESDAEAEAARELFNSWFMRAQVAAASSAAADELAASHEAGTGSTA